MSYDDLYSFIYIFQISISAADVEGSGFVRGGYRRSSTKYNDHHHRISRSDAEDDDDQDDPVADDHPNFV